MERYEKVGYKFHKYMRDEDKINEAINVIFQKLPIQKLIDLELKLFNFSVTNRRQENLRYALKNYLKQCPFEKHSELIIGLFIIRSEKFFSDVGINLTYEPRYMFIDKNDRIKQNITIFTGIERQFIFNDE